MNSRQQPRGSRRSGRLGVALFASLCASTVVHAGGSSGELAIGATVVANCLITTSPVDFGTYDPIDANSASAIDADGAIQTTCTTNSSPVITLGAGSNYNGGRRLSDGASDYLAYELYTNASRDRPWDGNGVPAASPDGSARSNTVYGRLPAGQNVPVGSYADTVLVTVTF